MCLFCKIVAGEIPSTKVYEDDWVYAFKDIEPIAPVHVLVVPKAHVESLAKADDEAMLGHLMHAVALIARELGVEEGGYRTILNTGAAAGQTVPHLHAHLLAGRAFGWSKEL